MASDASFADWCQQHNRSYPKKLARWLIPGFVLWWPLDILLFAERPDTLNAFAWMRSGALTVILLYLAAEKWTPLPRRYPSGLPITGMALLSFWLPFCLAQAGTLTDPWFHWLYIGLFAPVALLLPISKRILTTLGLLLLAFSGWYSQHSDVFTDPALPITLSYTLFASCASVWIGEQIIQFAQSKWRQECKMDEQRQTLHHQLEEKTSRLRTLATHLSATQENERRRLSQDLHDEFGQELAGIRYTIATLKRKYPHDPAITTSLQELEKQAAHLAETIRNILLDLRPRVLEDLGLQAALEWLVERISRQGEIRVRFNNEGTEVSISNMLGLTIYRFVQEALTNILKHANANNVIVELSWIEGNIHIKINDDGRGFDPTQPIQGMGLLGMKERLHGLGGQVDICSSPGKGTTIEGVVPASAILLTHSKPAQTDNSNSKI